MTASQQVKSTITGNVVGDKMDKTVTVQIERRFKHPMYKKYIRKHSKIIAHDENNECKVGDTVEIEQCRPISKRKSWRVKSVTVSSQ